MKQNCVVVSYDESLLKQPVKYALSTLCQVAGVPFRFVQMSSLSELKDVQLVVSYGPVVPRTSISKHIHIFSSSLFLSANYLKLSSLPESTTTWNSYYVFFQGTTESEPVIFQKKEHKYEIRSRLDIVASTFFLVTCYEELVKGGPFDQENRFPASSSILEHNNLLHRPLVNEYAELLKTWIHQVAPDIKFFERTYHGHDFAVAVTHDIDSLQRYPYPLRMIGKKLAVNKQVFSAAKMTAEYLAIKWLGQKDPFNNLDELIAWEKQVGIRSSLYFLPSQCEKDADYALDELLQSSSLKSLLSNGWEIGFHPGYWTYVDEKVFYQQVEYLKQQLPSVNNSIPLLQGGRQHFLRFRPPYTWRMWERAGMTYDTTLGFADHEGFRCGICQPYRPFDLLENRQMQLWEVPLTVMDCTLSRYRKFNPEQSQEIFRKLLKTVKHYHGVFVLLWHNDHFGENNVGRYHEIFTNFILEALKHGAYVGSMKDILSEIVS